MNPILAVGFTLFFIINVQIFIIFKLSSIKRIQEHQLFGLMISFVVSDLVLFFFFYAFLISSHGGLL